MPDLEIPKSWQPVMARRASLACIAVCISLLLRMPTTLSDLEQGQLKAFFKTRRGRKQLRTVLAAKLAEFRGPPMTDSARPAAPLAAAAGEGRARENTRYCARECTWS